MFDVAQTTAMNPRIVATRFCCEPAAMSEPTSEMPEIALVAAINGVCNNEGTREINSLIVGLSITGESAFVGK